MRERDTEAFLKFMLAAGGCGIETAVASYSENGKVAQVVRSGRLIESHDGEKVAAWLRARNAAGGQVWCRPAAEAHPLVMLDDLPVAVALAVCRKYRGAAVETSPGNAQVWIVLCKPLGRHERQVVAGALAELVGADPAAVSEPRWGRLPGFRQRKPGKTGWTNLLTFSNGPTLDPSPHLRSGAGLHPTGGRVPSLGMGEWAGAERGRDESKVEFAYALHCLRHSVAVDQIVAAVASRAYARGKRRTQAQAEGYARKTVDAASRKLLSLQSCP